MSNTNNHPPLPQNLADVVHWPALSDDDQNLAILRAAQQSGKPLFIITPDNFQATQLTKALRALKQSTETIAHFPDWETLPYDTISPHQDIISQRMHILHELPRWQQGILICSMTNLMQRIAPRSFINAHHFELKEGAILEPEIFRPALIDAGYRHVTQVMEHGEFLTRGAMIDIFPMGSPHPYRIELFDNEIESIRYFDPETQRSIETIQDVTLMPAKEFPLTEEATSHFRQQWRTEFSGNPALSPLYQDISEGHAPAGSEYFLPLFFEKTATLIDYLPKNSLILQYSTIAASGQSFLSALEKRYEQLSHDVTRPILKPGKLFSSESDIAAQCSVFPQIILEEKKRRETTEEQIDEKEPSGNSTLRQINQDAIIRNLTELKMGDPVVHLVHGVGRYQGLETVTVDDITDEYLLLIYADNTKLYVPVSQLQLISRYMGADADHAPIHRLGSDQWERAKEKAAKRIYDVAAELLAIYASRANKKAFQFKEPDKDYQKFVEEFPFTATNDQDKAINDVIQAMCSDKPMDHLVCGDVGFGKTEVAMRAAFLAIASNKQVTMLVPTTLLAQQHFENFQDRFSKWPISIDLLSRFRSVKEQKSTLEKLQAGKVDILIGTHRLLQKDIHFKNLGLIIIDEEHRFGVRHKETLKKLREEVDILALTATPIPRTLNMALSGTRDLSIIATPPAKRLSIKTLVTERSNHIILEAFSREILRGGQIYFLHNSVATIEKTAADLQALIPEAKIQIAHGQMREKQLEKVMADFHHQKFNVLICTTIIESGIDIPTANTIIIDRADKFGLSQLHQLRGRVGRSHHQAYAYLLTPHRKALTKDAKKRLEAIAALEDLGIGFTLATHDLEIRGAGEILGAEQSGHMEEVGFTLYMSMLEGAVQSLKDGKIPKFNVNNINDLEINLGFSAIIPETYLPDVQARLVLYKRIASVENQQALSTLKTEIIDRFGLLPEATQNLLTVTQLKLMTKSLGIKRINLGKTFGSIEFQQNTSVEPKKMIQLLQSGQGFRMDGPNKLKFTLKSDDQEARAEQLRDVIKQLD